MSILSTIVKTVVIERLVAGAVPIRESDKVGMALMVLSGFMALFAVLFFLIAGYNVLLSEYSTQMAAAIMGGIILALSAILGLSAYGLFRYRQKRFKHMQRAVTSNIQSFIDSISDEFDEPVRNNPKTAVALASLLGLAMGGRMH